MKKKSKKMKYLVYFFQVLSSFLAAQLASFILLYSFIFMLALISNEYIDSIIVLFLFFSIPFFYLVSLYSFLPVYKKQIIFGVSFFLILVFFYIFGQLFSYSLDPEGFCETKGACVFFQFPPQPVIISLTQLILGVLGSVTLPIYLSSEYSTIKKRLKA